MWCLIQSNISAVLSSKFLFQSSSIIHFLMSTPQRSNTIQIGAVTMRSGMAIAVRQKKSRIPNPIMVGSFTVFFSFLIVMLFVLQELNELVSDCIVHLVVRSVVTE